MFLNLFVLMITAVAAKHAPEGTKEKTNANHDDGKESHFKLMIKLH